MCTYSFAQNLPHTLTRTTHTLPITQGKLWVHDPPCATHAPGCKCRFRDIRSFHRFDGNHPHYTERFHGERYSVVYYTHKSFAKSKDKVFGWEGLCIPTLVT